MSGYNNGQYSFEQQVFCLSMLTTLSFNQVGTAKQIASRTRSAINTMFSEPAVIQLIGKWRLVWGPGVYGDSGRMANLLFLACPEQDPSQVVVAIAGTNGASIVDWFLEDFNVKKKVDWPYAKSPLHPQISKGIDYGLDKLVNLTDNSQKGKAVSARDYLKSQPSLTKIMVTGHSLGGALSPAYSLYLEDTLVEGEVSNKSISCLATAGQTQGDKNFSEYYGSKLAATTSRIWNSLDIVPHAFSEKDLIKIPGIYLPEIPIVDIIGLGVRSIASSVKVLEYTNVLPDAEPFQSKFIDMASLAGKYAHFMEIIELFSKEIEKQLNHTGKDIANFIVFIGEALIQHIIAYINYFKIDEFAELMHSTAAPSQPIIVDFGKASHDEIDKLKRGEGPLTDAVLKTVERLKEDGIVANEVQVVVAVVQGKFCL
jgi:hypothetical protein